MIYHQLISDILPSRKDISHAYLIDETRLVQSLIAQVELDHTQSSTNADRARQLIIKIREQAQVSGGTETLLNLKS